LLLKKFDLFLTDFTSSAIRDLKYMAKDPALILRRGNLKLQRTVKSCGYNKLEEMPEREQKRILA